MTGRALTPDNGQPQNGNLGDYMIASIQDLPHELNISVFEHLPANEIHGIGETGLPPVMPAIGNAVARASPACRSWGCRSPPEKILRSLHDCERRPA